MDEKMQLVPFSYKRRRSFMVRVRKRRRPQGRVFAGRFANGGELKFFDTIKTNTNVAETGTILDDSLNHIVQGVTESNRIGRKCTIKSVHFRGTINNNVGTDVSQLKQSVRIIVYLDKQANGATAAVADVLEDVTALNGYNSFRNLANSGRFRILYDLRKALIIPAVAQTAAGTFSSYVNQWSWSFNKVLNVPIEFSGVNGLIAEIRSNNIGILAISTDSDNLPQVNYTCRVRFSDS